MWFELLKKIYPEMDEVQLSLKSYCLGCVAHRLRKFGFESGINAYQPRDLAALAFQLPEHQKNVLMNEAITRGFDAKVLYAS